MESKINNAGELINSSQLVSIQEIPWNQWSKEGESKFLGALAAMIKLHKEDNSLKRVLNGYPKAIYELILHCINGPLTVEQVCSSIGDFLFWNSDIPSVIIDILAVLDMDLPTFDSSAPPKFISLCKRLSKIIPLKLFKERYELEPLTELDILPAKTFSSKLIRIKTRLYYKQNKFNLLREEMEGFSKLIVGVFNQRSLSDCNVSIKETKDLLLSLCGWFNLDPARVLDVVLDLFETNLEDSQFFVPIIEDFVKNSQVLFEVLNFRYSLHFNDNSTTKSLHQMVVILINNNILSFEDIFKELEPADEVIYSEIDSITELPTLDQKIALTAKKSSNEEDNTDDYFEFNQKLGFCEVLILSGRWDLFMTILNEQNKEYFMQQQCISEATCSYIHYLIDPLYDKFSGLGSKIHRKKPVFDGRFCKIQPVTTWTDWINDVLPVILTLGPSIHYDSSLIFKLTRLLIAAKSKLLSSDSINSPPPEMESKILNIVEKSLLPALSYLECNCCVAEIIWDLLKKLSVSVRYCAYSNWKEYCLKCPVISKKRPQTLYLIRNCLKKVSKENVKPMGRIMGKLSHYAPADLFDQILFQIQMHDSLIGPIVESLKYLNSLAYDILVYSVIEALKCDPSSRALHDGNLPLPWFSNTVNFCAALVKKYPVDITGILKYVMEQLLAKNYIVLLVLKEILHKMTGIEITDEMTDDQIDALGGGECLRGEAAYYVPLRSMKKSANRLKEALLQEDLLAAMAILIAQLKYTIVFEEEQDFHLKFLGKLYDECHHTLLQFGTFISGTALEESDIEFPSLETLVLDYHINHESAFFLCRQFLIYKGKIDASKNGRNLNPSVKSNVINSKGKELKHSEDIKCIDTSVEFNSFAYDKHSTPVSNASTESVSISPNKLKMKKQNDNISECSMIVSNPSSTGNQNSNSTLAQSDNASFVDNSSSLSTGEDNLPGCNIQSEVEDDSDVESWGIGDESFEIPSAGEEDFLDHVDKNVLGNKLINSVNDASDDFCCNYDWDADDKKTWIQHNDDNSSIPLSTDSCNKLLEYEYMGESSEYLDDDDEVMNCEKEVFDIPKMFDVVITEVPECIVDSSNEETAECNEVEACEVTLIEDTDEDTSMDLLPSVTKQNNTDNTDIIGIHDTGSNNAKEVKEDKLEKGSSKSFCRSDRHSTSLSISSEQGLEDIAEEGWSKEKKIARSVINTKLVNILLDWVLPSVLTIQDTTSFISEEISPYATAVFWTLTIYDIYVPVELYDKEIAKLKNVLSNEHSKDSNFSKAKKEQEKINLLIDKLSQEKKIHIKHVKSVIKKLDETKNEWFATHSQRSAKNDLINVLLHSCILPRVLFSAMDAVYCAKFILMLHQLHIGNFSTVLCYDRLLCDIKNLVALCSENEASRFGRFLCAVLTDIMRFHSSQDIYNAECANTPGFVTKFRSCSEHIDGDKMHYENFRHLCHKWHYKICKALLCLLDSKEYVLIRNTIIVLDKILPKFPVIIQLAQCIEKKVAKVKQEEKNVRKDLHALAMSYWGMLTNRMPNMLNEGDFHLVVSPGKGSTQEQESEINDSGNENNTSVSQPVPAQNQSEESDNDKSDDENDYDEDKEESFPLAKTVQDDNKKQTSGSENSTVKSEKESSDLDGSPEEKKNYKSSAAKQCSKEHVRSTRASSSKGKRPHSETVKKPLTRSKSIENRKTRKKHKSKSRSKSIEFEPIKKEKKPKLKREYASPESKKSRKKEKKSSKRKDHESPEIISDKKHKISNSKSKRTYDP